MPVIHSISYCIRSINQSINQLINQSINHQANHSFIQSLTAFNQSINQSINQTFQPSLKSCCAIFLLTPPCTSLDVAVVITGAQKLLAARAVVGEPEMYRPLVRISRLTGREKLAANCALMPLLPVGRAGVGRVALLHVRFEASFETVLMSTQGAGEHWAILAVDQPLMLFQP
jgi:hypothetical protein